MLAIIIFTQYILEIFHISMNRGLIYLFTNAEYSIDKCTILCFALNNK